MELIARTLKLPCNYSKFGCAVALQHNERGEHEETCEFRPYTCPILGPFCTWEGSLEEVAPHLMTSHCLIPTDEDKDINLSIGDINEPGPVPSLHMLSRFGHNFLVGLYKPNAVFRTEQSFVTIQLIGSRKEAKNFSYRLKLNGQGSCVTWESTIRSIHERDFSAIRERDCLVLNPCTVKDFADNGKLSFDVSISMV
ncbi:E3 ubiquitin-protein ligase Siah2 [Cryptotermes secundus]|nr:E3 ubiquitin-protein ligase Siah2 [Cryptotermes secundus]